MALALQESVTLMRMGVIFADAQTVVSKAKHLAHARLVFQW